LGGDYRGNALIANGASRRALLGGCVYFARAFQACAEYEFANPRGFFIKHGLKSRRGACVFHADLHFDVLYD
jgi:hypothetical protein